MPAVRSLKAASRAADVVGGNESHTRQQRLEIAAVFGLAGDGERAQRAAVKGIFQRDDFELLGVDGVAVRADHLERAFHGLRAGVGEEGALEAARLGQALRQRTLVLVIVKIGAVDQQAGLLADHLEEARVGVSQRVHADSGDEIQIAAAFRVVDVAAFAAGQNQRIAGIILEVTYSRSRSMTACGGRAVIGGRAPVISSS